MVKRKKLKGRRKKQRGGDGTTGRTDPNHLGPSASPYNPDNPPPSYADSQRMSKNKIGSSKSSQVVTKLANIGGQIQQIGGKESDFVTQILFFIGILTFIVGIFSNSMHTMLIAYGCMMAGVAMSFMMILIWSSNNSKSENILQLFNKITPLILPTLCLLGTLVVLVFIFTKAKNAFKDDGCNIPGIFNKFNYLTFIFLTIQIYLLNKFYGQYKKTIRSGKDLGNMKWVYVSGFILSSILTLAFSSELYTIVISFLTDG